MIAGETEHLLGLDSQEAPYYAYDELFGLGGKKKQKTRSKRTPEEREARREKRKNFWSGIENRVKDSGGLEGVATTASNIVNLFRRGRSAPAPPTDYQVALGGTPPPEENKVPTGVYIAGGVVLAGLVAWGLMKKKNPVTPSSTP